MKSGFSLLELMFAVVMSAMLATILYNSFNQSNISLAITGEYKDVDTNEVIVIHQMEQDLAGVLLLPQERKKKTTTEVATAPIEKEKEASNSAKATTDKKPLTKNFVYVSKNNNLQLFTFFTLNPRALHNGKPRLVRVVYRLKERKGKEKVYLLTRQESLDLDFDAMEKTGEKRPRELVVSDAVELCSCEFIYTKTVQEEGSGKTQEKIEKVTEWDTDKNRKEDTKDKKPPLPQAVNLSLSVWDETFAVKRSINYQMPIYTYGAAQDLEQKAEQSQQQQQQQTASPMPNRTPTQSAQVYQSPLQQMPSYVPRFNMGGRVRQPFTQRFIRN